MDGRLDEKEKRLLSQLHEDGTARGNKAVRETLGWGEKAYLEVREALLQKGAIALGRGRGGSVRRVYGDDQALLAKVPTDGTSISNPKLIERLGWPRELYWEVRNRLIESGDLGTGRGRGGAVFRASGAGDEEDEEDEDDGGRVEPGRSIRVERESPLYPSLKKVLETDWAAVEGVEDPIVEISARGGRRLTGGTWTRPDLIMVGKRSFELLIPQQALEVWTFEVKAVGWDMRAIHEANANGRYATRACALLQIKDDATGDKMQRYEHEARRIGVGLITFVKADKWDTWETLVEPQVRTPDYTDTAGFLEQQMSSGGIDRIKSLWHKRESRSYARERTVPSRCVD